MSTSLSNYTTMQVGGPASRFVSADTREALIREVRAAWSAGEPWFILGGGSNTVFSDRGFSGTVIHVTAPGIEIVERTGSDTETAPQSDTETAPQSDITNAETRRGEHVIVRVSAGEPWDAVVAWSVEHGFHGIEALSGIPGTAGAAPIQNIGAYGQELSQTLTAVEFLDETTDQISWIPASDLDLAFRHSIFKRGKPGVILGIEMRLGYQQLNGVGVSAPIEFDQLVRALDVSPGTQLPVSVVRDIVLGLRASKGMVFDAHDPDTHGCGSFFVNPIVTEQFANDLPASAPKYPVDATAWSVPERLLQPGDDVPALASVANPAPRLVKLSAAWLIEHAGVTKGYRVPGSRAAISSKHALAITNTGGATADEVMGLARYVQALVQSQFGLLLQPEPTLVGVEL